MQRINEPGNHSMDGTIDKSILLPSEFLSTTRSKGLMSDRHQLAATKDKSRMVHGAPARKEVLGRSPSSELRNSMVFL